MARLPTRRHWKTWQTRVYGAPSSPVHFSAGGEGPVTCKHKKNTQRAVGFSFFRSVFNFLLPVSDLLNSFSFWWLVPSFFIWQSAGWLARRAAAEEGIVDLPPVGGDDESVAPAWDLFGRRCCGKKSKEEQPWLRRSGAAVEELLLLEDDVDGPEEE